MIRHQHERIKLNSGAQFAGTPPLLGDNLAGHAGYKHTLGDVAKQGFSVEGADGDEVPADCPVIKVR
jgi:hypothetical protein